MSDLKTSKYDFTKIGVFGDSFTNLKSEENPTPTWVDILNEKYDVTNFGLTSSNLYYSVNEFIKNHKNFDKIIFVATAPGRLQIADWITVNKEHKYIAGINSAKYVLKRSIIRRPISFTDDIKLAYQAAIDYYLYLDDFRINNFIQQLMIDKVKELRPDSILIPTNISSFGEPRSMNVKTLVDIYMKENIAWEEKEFNDQKKDIRNCHITAENNVILAKQVEEWLNGSPVEIKLDDFVTPMNKEFYLKDYE